MSCWSASYTFKLCQSERSKSPVAYARGSERGILALPNRDRKGVGAVVFADQRLQWSATGWQGSRFSFLRKKSPRRGFFAKLTVFNVGIVTKLSTKDTARNLHDFNQ
jgi:hypothetical protein